MKALTDHTLDSLRAQFSDWDAKPSHADRLLRAFYNSGGNVDVSELRLGRELTARLENELPLRRSKILKRSESADGTIKLLVGFDNGGAVESVLMPTPIADRAAGCVSSQIGCAMGCDFCASTRRGLERDLEAGEIVEQFLHLKAVAIASGRRLSTLVFMGMGEPLQNLDNVLAGIRRIGGEELGALGWKQITVSTVGIVPEMYRLAESKPNVNLALSLHAPDDVTRARIVPMNQRYPVQEIVAAARHYYETTRRITNLEYCVLRGVNDSDDHARALADLLDGFRTHVNLIPYNSIGESLSGLIYQKPEASQIDSFEKILRERGVVTHRRRTRGEDVNAACGQLREMAIAEK